MARGSPQANIVGGILLILLDLWCIERGRLPLKGHFDTGIDLDRTPELFRAYAACLGAIGVAAILWGLRGLGRR